MTDGRDLDDPALDALLRAHSQETASPAVDAAILAAAHRAVASAPRAAARPPSTPAWRGWMPIAAAAAIAAVVIGVLPHAPTIDTDPKHLPAAENASGDAPSASPPPAPAAPSPARPMIAPIPRESAAAGASAKSDAASGLGTPPAADWIARIRALRDEGRIEEAARELARFRAAFSDADARLPPDLRPWAGSLRR